MSVLWIYQYCTYFYIPPQYCSSMLSPGTGQSVIPSQNVLTGRQPLNGQGYSPNGQAKKNKNLLHHKMELSLLLAYCYHVLNMYRSITDLVDIKGVASH